MTSPLPRFQPDELIVNYHDAVVYGSDLNCFETRTEWLTDSCIHFGFSLLQEEHRRRQPASSSSFSLPHFLFMDPSVVSFWMHQCVDQDEIEDFVGNTKFPSSGFGDNSNSNNNNADGLIFVAVNDTMDTDGSSSYSWQTLDNGSHWSLLVIEVVRVPVLAAKETTTTISLSFWHFDSVPNSGNLRAANAIARKMRMHVYPNAEIITTETKKENETGTGGTKTKPASLVRSARTPKQHNGYDCGVHVLGSARILSSHYSSGKHRYREQEPDSAPSRNTNSVTTNANANDTANANAAHRLEQLEDCLRTKIGERTDEFCADLRIELSTEIRRLHGGENPGKHR